MIAPSSSEDRKPRGVEVQSLMLKPPNPGQQCHTREVSLQEAGRDGYVGVDIDAQNLYRRLNRPLSAPTKTA